MKKLLFTVMCTALFFGGLNAQQDLAIAWEKTYGSVGNNLLQVTISDGSGGYYTGGSKNGDAWLQHLDGTGNLLWEETYGGSNTDWISAITLTDDGGIAFAGYTASTDGDFGSANGHTDALIGKVGASGVLLWSKVLGGTQSDGFWDIIESSNGDLIVGGHSWSSNGDFPVNEGANDLWMCAFSASGSLNWKTRVGGMGSESVQAVTEAPNGDYMFASGSSSSDGDFAGSYGSSDVWIHRLQSNGNVVAGYNYGGSSIDEVYDIVLDNNNDFVVSGSTRSNDVDVSGNHGNSDVWVFKISPTGTLLWQNAIGGPQNDKGTRCIVTPTNAIVVTGTTKSSSGDFTLNQGGSDVFWIKLEGTTGNLLGQSTYGGSNDEEFNFPGWSVLQTEDFGYVLAGTSRSDDGDVTPHVGSGSGWVLKLEPNCLSCDPLYTEDYAAAAISTLTTGLSCESRTLELPPAVSCYSPYVDWGDGSGFQLYTAGTTISHTYSTGSYQVCVNLRRNVSNGGQVCGDDACTKLTIDCEDCGLWPKKYGSNDPGNVSADIERGDGILVDQFENVYVHGRVRTSTVFDDGSTMANGTFLAKYDSCGQLIWVQDVTQLGEKMRKFEMDGNGNIILLAWTGNGVFGSIDNYYLSKITSAGTILWSNTIEHKYLPWPSFDVDQNSNNIYLALNLNQTLKYKDQTGNNVINLTTAGSPNTAGAIVCVNPNGYVTYQEEVHNVQGLFRFQDVVVAESVGRIFFTGAMKDVSFLPNPIVQFTNSGNTVSSFLSKDVLLASYSTTGFGPTYSWGTSTGNQSYETAMQLAYSNTNNVLVLKNYQTMSTYTPTGANISSFATLFGTSGRMRYNDQENCIMLTGTTNCNELRLAKYNLTGLVWDYTLSTCGYNKAFVYDVNFSPLTNRLYFTGTYWKDDLTLLGTTMPLSGGRDVFISHLNDGGGAPYETDLLPEPIFQTKSEPTAQSKETLSLYPNPTNRVLNIQIPEASKSTTFIQVRDVFGRVILEESSSELLLQLNTEELANGTYFISIVNADERWTKTFVKQ